MKFTKSVVFSGIAALSAVLMSSGAFATCTGNTNPTLVKNGSFESGSGSTITDWSVAFADGGIQLSTSEKRSGTQSLQIGTEHGENRLYQTISGATSGDVYTVCFYLYNGAGNGPTSFRAQWNNQDLIAIKDSPPFGFTYYAFNVVATGNDVLSFEGRNDPSYFYLDNVYVQLCSACEIQNDVRGRKTAPSQFVPFKKP